MINSKNSALMFALEKIQKDLQYHSNNADQLSVKITNAYNFGTYLDLVPNWVKQKERHLDRKAEHMRAISILKELLD
jgi:hypothetical protein